MKDTYLKNGVAFRRRQNRVKSPADMRALQLRINTVTRQDQQVIGSQPSSFAEVSRAPLRSAKQGALAKRRAA